MLPPPAPARWNRSAYIIVLSTFWVAWFLCCQRADRRNICLFLREVAWSDVHYKNELVGEMLCAIEQKTYMKHWLLCSLMRRSPFCVHLLYSLDVGEDFTKLEWLDWGSVQSEIMEMQHDVETCLSHLLTSSRLVVVGYVCFIPCKKAQEQDPTSLEIEDENGRQCWRNPIWIYDGFLQLIAVLGCCSLGTCHFLSNVLSMCTELVCGQEEANLIQ